MAENTAFVIIGIVIGIGVFILLREFWCWYFKINKKIDLLGKILERLPEPEKHPESEIAGVQIRQDTIVICKKCGSFKIKDGYCPHCNSGWVGKKVKKDTWDVLAGMAEEQGKSLNVLIREMAVCRKCGILKKIDVVCPNCGSV